MFFRTTTIRMPKEVRVYVVEDVLGAVQAKGHSRFLKKPMEKDHQKGG